MMNMIDCNWNTPGHAPFRGGDIVAAIESYKFPDTVKSELVYKIQKGYNDASVFITKDEIKAAFGKAENLRDMHYAGGRRCSGPVTRDRWGDNDAQPALVYCVDVSCVVVPIICGNIARIDYTPFVRPEPAFRPQVQYHAVPEPSTLWLVIAAALVIKYWRRRLFGRAPGCNPVVG